MKLERVTKSDDEADERGGGQKKGMGELIGKLRAFFISWRGKEIYSVNGDTSVWRSCAFDGHVSARAKKNVITTET